MTATALNLANPQTWVPESEKTDKIFGESPEQRTQRHEQEQFGVGRPTYTPRGTVMDPAGSDLERLISQWSSPEQIPLLMASAGGKLGLAMIAQMVPGVVDDFRAIATGEGTEEEKRDRVNNLFSMALLVAHGKSGVEPGAAAGRVARETIADVRGRRQAGADERAAFAGRDWTADIDYDALTRDLAVPGARVMQRPSVVPPEGVVSPVGPMERIPPPRAPRPIVPESGEASFEPPPPIPPRQIGSYQDAVEILRERGNPQLTKAQILAMFPETIPNMEAAGDLALETWGPQWRPADQQRQLAPQRFGYPEMQRAVIAPPGAPPSPLVSPPEAARAAETMTREATAGYGPEAGIPRPARPAVPGTPAQSRENVIAEIRRRNLDTINKILVVFPSLEGHRERARALRNQAWGKPPETTTEESAFQAVKAQGVKGSDILPPAEAGPKALAEAQRIIAELRKPPGGQPEAPTGPGTSPEPPGGIRTPPKAPGAIPGPVSPGPRNTGEAYKAGLAVRTLADLEALAADRRSRQGKGPDLLRRAQEATDPAERERLLNAGLAINAQLPREAIEAATNTGSAVEGPGTNLGKRPLDWREHPEVAAWLKANAAELGIELPDELKPSKSDRDWDLFYENLTDQLDSFNPARGSGRINYELNDVAQRFVDFARKDKSGKSITELLSDFSQEDDASKGQLSKLSQSVKSLVGQEKSASAPGPPNVPPKPGGPLLEVPKAPKPLEAERQQIVRLLQSLETEDERAWLSQKDRLTPREGKEDTVARLRKRLAEIEAQLLPGGTKPAEPATAAPIPATKVPESATEAPKPTPPIIAPPAKGMVRLYSGSGGTGGAGHGGSWFTENPQRAASFGPNVTFVDVPASVAKVTRQGIKTDYVLPDKWVRKAAPFKVEQKVHDLDAEADSPAAAPQSQGEAPPPGPPAAAPAASAPTVAPAPAVNLPTVNQIQAQRTKVENLQRKLKKMTAMVPPPIRQEVAVYLADQQAKLDEMVKAFRAAGQQPPPEEPATAQVGVIDKIKGQTAPLRPAGPQATALRAKAAKWAKALPGLEAKEAAASEAHRKALTSGDRGKIEAATAALNQAHRNAEGMKKVLAQIEGDIGIARMRDEAAAVKGIPQPEGTQTITSKTLKTQKSSLLEQVSAAIKEAPEEGAEKITISVPGDGDWTIPNTKESLKKFRDHAEKQFPESVPGDGMPRLPSGKAKALPKVADPKPADLPKIPGTFASTDESRFVLLRTYADGTQIVGTDGRQLIRVVSDQAPGRPDAPVRLTPDGEVDLKAEGRFPNWKIVGDLKAELVFGGADTAQLLHLANQGKVFRDTSISDKDKRASTAIELFVNKDKSFGARMAAAGDEFGHNLQDGALRLGSYNVDLLINALNAARKLGNERVDLYMHNGVEGPLGMVGKNHESLTMGLRIEKDTPLRDEPSAFLGVAGRAEHPRLPKGLGPLTNPDDLISRTPDMGAAGKWNVELLNGEIKVNQGKQYKNYGGKTETSWSLRGTKPLSEWPKGAKAQHDFIRSLLKDAPIETAEARAAVAKGLHGAIGELVLEHDDLVAETEKRRAGQVLGFGGAVGKIAARIPPLTQAALVQVQQQMTPGLNILGKIKQGFASLLLPGAKSPAHLRAAELLGQFIGRMNHRAESARDQLRGASRFFDRMGLEREGLAPAANPGTKFRSDVSMGRPLTPGLQRIADLMDKLFAERLDLLEAADAPLKTIRDNYFPGLWTMESRLAFNAALEELIKRGAIPKDIDLNAATPAQRDAVKALTDEYLKAGKGSDNDMLPYLTKRPLAGRESFRKQKVFEDIMDAEQFGLRPVSYNPIDLVKVKLAEMDRSVMMHEYVQALKGQKDLRIINPYEEVPKGWQKLDDRYGIIYGPPTVKIPEYIDKAVYEGLVGFAKSLGIKHVRSMKFPPGPGQQALGLSYQGQNLIRSKFATETSVIAHEIGHQLDYRYGFWNRFVEQAVGLGAKGTQTKGASQIQRGKIRQELRNIADMTGSRGGDPRKKVEQIAQMVEAYVHAPDKMKQVAPTVHQVFDDFIKSEPSLKALADIRPGIELTRLTGEKYVGLPIMGYRIVPDAHGDIINNYLSKSLYNNPYVGTLYKGWMGMANSLNQTQLGMGSAFHGGFTTIEAMVSSGANVIKDVYGVLRGNRSIGDLATTAANSIISMGRNPVVGNRVLNAWRERTGTINPRIAQVIKAAEVAGYGFKLEHGMMTEQTVKMLRNYYSGQYLKAAARSPVALTELLAKPIMEYLVPRQKAGVFADLAWRIIEQNPGKTPEELAPEFRQAGNRVDARLGQVRYDRLFMRNTAKNLVQAFIRAPGWSGGTITEIGGGFTDAGRWLAEFARTGRLPDNLPDRTAYVLSLMTGVCTANGVLTYAFTGQRPSGMDFFAFRTGQKDDYGNEERFVLPSYVKDILAYSRHPGETLANKTHPMLSMFNDLSRNKDYYGVEIRERGAPGGTQAGQAVGYVVRSWEPFWTRGLRRERARGAGAARQLAPLIGVMPASRSVTETPAESLAHDLMQEQIPPGPRTREEAARSRAAAAARPHEPYLEHVLRRLKAPSAVLVLERANPEERRRIAGLVNDRIANSRVLTDDEKDALSARVNRAGGE